LIGALRPGESAGVSAPETSGEPREGSGELDLGAGKRRNLIAALGLVVVAGVIAALVVRRATGLPPIDRETREEVRAALDETHSSPPQLRRALGARAFVELERERLPPGLLSAFEGLDSVPPGMGDMVLLAPFSENEEALHAWTLACTDGADALAEAMTTGKGARGLYARCKLERLGLLGPLELGAVSTGQLVATHASWAYLLEHHAQTKLERRVLRTLLGC
jgi:hypothetical protein